MTLGEVAVEPQGQARQAELSGGGGADGLDDVADDRRHEPLIVALGHDADDGLGPRRADEQPPALAELRLAGSIARTTRLSSSGLPLS